MAKKRQNKQYGGPVKPTITNEESEFMNIFTDINKRTMEGASMGSVGGPWGTLIGAVAGSVTGTVEAGLDISKENKGNEAAMDKYKFDKMMYERAEEHFNKGGKVKGKKGIDNIELDAQKGSFIIPKNKSEVFLTEVAIPILGWKRGQIASKNNGSVDINVSAGELYLTKEDVIKAEGAGIDLFSYAPDAKKGNNFQYGGEPDWLKGYDDYFTKMSKGTKPNDNKSDYLKKFRDLSATEKAELKLPLGYENLLKDTSDNIASGTGPTEGDMKKPPPKDTDLSKFKAGDYLSAMQIGLGMVESFSGEEPDTPMPTQYKEVTEDAAERAKYGFTKLQLSEMDKSLERTLGNLTRTAVEASGGSGAVALGNIKNLQLQKEKGLLNINVADQKIREQKQMLVDKYKIDWARAQERHAQYEYEKYMQEQAAAAELIGAGIHNIVGMQESDYFKTALEGA